MPAALSAFLNLPAYHSWSIFEPALRMAEDALVVALERRHATAVCHQRLGESGGERDRTLTLLGLRLADPQDALDQVDVAPPEPL